MDVWICASVDAREPITRGFEDKSSICEDIVGFKITDLLDPEANEALDWKTTEDHPNEALFMDEQAGYKYCVKEFHGTPS